MADATRLTRAHVLAVIITMIATMLFPVVPALAARQTGSDLAVSLQVIGAWERGMSASYRVTVRNEGDRPVTWPFEVRAHHPGYLTADSVDAPGASCSGGEPVRCQYGEGLAAGGEVELLISVLIDVTGPPEAKLMVKLYGSRGGDTSNDEAKLWVPLEVPTVERGPSGSDTEASDSPGAGSDQASGDGSVGTPNVESPQEDEPSPPTPGGGEDMSPSGDEADAGAGQAPVDGEGTVAADEAGSAAGTTPADQTVIVRQAEVATADDLAVPELEPQSHEPPVDPPAPTPDLAVTLAVAAELEAGGDGVLTATVANIGPGAAGPVDLRVNLPGFVQVTSVGGEGWTCDPPATNVTCRHPAELASGVTTTVSIELTAPDQAGATGTATARVGTSGDRQRDNDTDQLRISISAGDPPADPPADEPPADEPPADEPPAEDPPVAEPPAPAPPSEDPPTVDPPRPDPPADETLVPDPPTQDPAPDQAESGQPGEESPPADAPVAPTRDGGASPPAGSGEAGPSEDTSDQRASLVARPDRAVTSEDVPVAIGVLANDEGVTGPAIVLDPPGFGTVSPGADGTLVYLPPADFHGLVDFVYQVGGADGATATARVVVVVEPANDRPRVTNGRADVGEDGTVRVDLLELAADPDGDRLVVSWTTQGGHGAVDLEAGVATYRPEAAFIGEDSFTFEVCDPAGACGVATVAIVVYPVNDLILAAGPDLEVALSPTAPAPTGITSVVLAATGHAARGLALPLAAAATVMLGSLAFGLESTLCRLLELLRSLLSRGRA